MIALASMDSESAFVVIDVVVFVQPLSAGAGSIKKKWNTNCSGAKILPHINSGRAATILIDLAFTYASDLGNTSPNKRSIPKLAAATAAAVVAVACCFVLTISTLAIAQNSTLTAMFPNNTQPSNRLGLFISVAAILHKRCLEAANWLICLRERLKRAVSEPEKKAEQTNSSIIRIMELRFW